jgi:hypothetical protein
LDRGRASNDRIAKEIYVFQPHQFRAAEERQCLERFNRGSNAGGGLLCVVRAAIDNLDAEITRVRRCQLRRKFRGDAFHFTFIRTNNGVDFRS